MDYKFENISVIDFVKTIAIYKGLNIQKLLTKLNENKNYSNSYSGFYNKLKFNTLKFTELKDIANELGYEIILREK